MTIKDPNCGMPVDPEETEFSATAWGGEYYFCSEYCMKNFLSEPRIAYFSMEIGLESEIPTYSGGLGVLGGDTVRSSADLRIPFVAVTLVSRRGYIKQEIDDEGNQIEITEEWDPSNHMVQLPEKVSINVEGREVMIKAWVRNHHSPTGGVVPVLFLDTDIDGNAPEDRRITDFLYGGDNRYRFKQEVVLGVGGVRILDALGFDIKKYHMNEGHSSLLTLELLKRNDNNQRETKNRCIFTTHTPVEAALDKFSYDMVKEVLGDQFSLDLIKRFGGEERLNMTLLALNLSKYTNGVSETHADHSRKLFPGYYIKEINNGVHSRMWTSEPFRELFDQYIPSWVNEPELLVRVDTIPHEDIWSAHRRAKNNLLTIVNNQTKAEMKEDVLTLGFARRAAEYKRPTLVFSDLDKLREANEEGSIQLIFAGKAHPADKAGKDLIREIFAYGDELRGEIEIAYLENYDMELGRKLTSGVDVWLNTPMPPLEASGTSGMKAAHNGVMNFSVLDGWWAEGCIEDVTGWAIGPPLYKSVSDEERRKKELKDLYNKLEYSIIPKFYKERDNWITNMKGAIGKVAYYFNSHRMMRRYVTEAYL